MKIYSILSVLLLTAAWPLCAQSNLQQVLQSVEQNNKELKTNRQLTIAQQLEARTGNSLPDPTVSYERLYGAREELGKTGELTVAQSFDFPTVYTNKSKIAQLKSDAYDKQGRLFRQDVLLRAQEVCLDLIALNQQKSLLERRQHNASRLYEDYAHRLTTGDATILEVNKIRLELLNVKTEVRLNESSRQTKLSELQALNGDIAVLFTDTIYPVAEPVVSYAQLKTDVLAASLQLHTLQSEQAIARRNVSLNRAMWLPKFEVGYRYNTGTGEQFNGFVVGVSIPLWENRHKVKQAKAQTRYTEMQYESTSLQLVAGLRGLYDQLKALEESMDEYKKVVNLQQNMVLLDKALAAGQISTIDYFVEMTTIHQSLQNYIQLENQYQKIRAQIYKFTL